MISKIMHKNPAVTANRKNSHTIKRNLAIPSLKVCPLPYSRVIFVSYVGATTVPTYRL
jgi:hypothetical protein